MKKLYAIGSYVFSSIDNKSFILLREIDSEDLDSNISNHWVRSEKVKQTLISNPKSILSNFKGIFAKSENAKEFMEEIKSKTWCPKDIYIIELVFQDKEKKEND